MITPQFKVDQDNEFVYIKIRAPNIKAAAVEFFVEKDLFIFSLHPYYLRLRFPGNIVDDEEKSKSDYNLSTSVISVRIAKEIPGTHFEDLDMTTKLLARLNEPNESSSTQPKMLIQEIGEEIPSKDDVSSYDPGIFDWELPQETPKPFEEVDPTLKPKYGFDNMYSGVLDISVMNGNDINDLPDPDKTPRQDRGQLRIQMENLKFDEDHYVADFVENEEIIAMIAWKLPPASSEFTTAESDLMLKLPKKSYLLDDPRIAYLNIIQLLFGYCYDYRTTYGESTVESAWTIGKLLPMFSCLDTPNNVRDIVVACTRRALSYPLYRHWELTVQVWKDVSEIVSRRKRAILKALLHLNELFNHDLYQAYNQIWIQDYCAWIQQANDNVISSLAQELNKVRLQKAETGFNLESLEEIGKSMYT